MFEILQKTIQNTKGISAIFATLTLIAIAVIAGIVTYMFTSGAIAMYTGGQPESQERFVVHSFDMAADPNGTIASLDIYAQNVCEMGITINAIIFKDVTGNTIDVMKDLTTPLNPKELTIISPLGLDQLTGTYEAGNYYTITLVSVEGTIFTSLTEQAN